MSTKSMTQSTRMIQNQTAGLSHKSHKNTQKKNGESLPTAVGNRLFSCGILCLLWRNLLTAHQVDDAIDQNGSKPEQPGIATKDTRTHKKRTMNLYQRQLANSSSLVVFCAPCGGTFLLPTKSIQLSIEWLKTKQPGLATKDTRTHKRRTKNLCQRRLANRSYLVQSCAPCGGTFLMSTKSMTQSTRMIQNQTAGLSHKRHKSTQKNNNESLPTAVGKQLFSCGILCPLWRNLLVVSPVDEVAVARLFVLYNT
jgi:hypothetical protein